MSDPDTGINELSDRLDRKMDNMLNYVNILFVSFFVLLCVSITALVLKELFK